MGVRTLKNGAFSAAGKKGILSLPLGDTYHGIILVGDPANNASLANITRLLLKVQLDNSTEYQTIDIDPRRLLLIDEYKAGNAADRPEICYIDFTEPDAKDPASEFLGSYGTANLATFSPTDLAAFGSTICGKNVTSLKVEIEADTPDRNVNYIESWRRVSAGTPLSNSVLTILPQTNVLDRIGRNDIKLPFGANCPHIFKRHWMFEKKINGQNPQRITSAELWKNSAPDDELPRFLNEYIERRYKGVPNPEFFCLDHASVNYNQAESLKPQLAKDLYLRVYASDFTTVDIFTEAYTDLSKGAI